ncbi:hypothetical protein JDBV08_00590 [Mycobacterium phage jiawei]|nr:hypothetical protein JDBV08_00590 [Mycobacterium phage jiawei]
MNLPGPFAEIITLDRKLSAPVVQITDIKRRRHARREAQLMLGQRGDGGRSNA